MDPATAAPRPASVFAVSITPFDADGRVDEPAFRRHLQRMVAAGVGVYVGGGGSGEGFVLTADERRQVLELAAEELGGKVAFRSMGVETRSAGEMIDYLRVAEAAGVLPHHQVFKLQDVNRSGVDLAVDQPGQVAVAEFAGSVRLGRSQRFLASSHPYNVGCGRANPIELRVRFPLALVIQQDD